MAGQSSREVMRRTLTFDHPERIGCCIFALPVFITSNPEAHAAIIKEFPNDIDYAPAPYEPSSCLSGDPFAEGKYVDEWGCIFSNINAGVIGEVKDPLIPDLEDLSNLRPPYEQLPKDEAAAIAKVNEFCRNSDKFIFAGCNPRPWERYQFLRGTEEAMMDMALQEENVFRILKEIEDFYMKEIEFWCKTDVDAIFWMDDWGSQQSLLISPETWRQLFKPIYKKFIDCCHKNGKFAFMHSDGFIEAILPDLIELGLDAGNFQIGCMNLENLAAIAKGKFTFFGEIDRQLILPGTPEDGIRFVRKVAEHLFDPAGGIVKELELGGLARPETALAAMREWDKIAVENGMKVRGEE